MPYNNLRNQNLNQNQNNKHNTPQHERKEHRDYGHIHERVEETSSTKKPPKER